MATNGGYVKLLISTIGVIFWLDAALAQEHHLTVAVNPALPITSDEVDLILAKSTAILRRKDFDWDVACNVQLVRHGDIIRDPNIPLSSNFNDVKVALQQVTPTANVALVQRLSCSGVDGVAGCANVGSSPMAIVPTPGYDALVWAHERGHNTGIRHAPGQGTPSSSNPPEIGKRVMFWQVGPDHFGLTTEECDKFKFNALAVTVATMLPSTTDADRPAGQQLAASDKSNYDSESLPTAQETRLTPAAYQVVAFPWVDRAPTEAIDSLDEADLASISDMLQGEPNPYWPRALEVLRLRGGAEAIPAVENALTLPLTALPPNPSPESLSSYRLLQQIKLAAPAALGAIAHRTKSEAGVDALLSALQTESGRDGVEPFRKEFQFEVIIGLAQNPENEEAVAIVRSVISGGSSLGIAPSTPAAATMQSLSEFSDLQRARIEDQFRASRAN